MFSVLKRSATESAAPPVRVRTEGGGDEWCFARPFRIGRGEHCEVRIVSGLVSREHAEVIFKEGAWWVRDLGSTNGIFVDGRKVRETSLPGQATLSLGHQAPTLHLTVEGAAASGERASAPGRGRRTAGRGPTTPSPLPPRTGGKQAADPATPPGRAASEDPLSMSQIVHRYFESSDPAGERTRIIRKAYVSLRDQQKRRYRWIIAGVLLLLLGAVAYAVVQRQQNERLRAQAVVLHDELKRQDLDIAQLRQAIEETSNETLDGLLLSAQVRRSRTAAAYDGLIEEFGLYRRLNEEERRIYRLARVFNESQFSIPAGFVREVQRTIREYWLTSAGRGRFHRAIERADANGHTPLIVETLLDYGLPAEFFYLALQESNLDPNVFGTLTRWGRAKGMWQFIPSTAQRYGLDVGARPDLGFVDPRDERHDVEKATDAAARYLLYIYSTPAQASGLLVMASYNWGEHRVIDKLKDLPNSEEAIAAAFEGIAETPDERNYWRFLEAYSDRMPDETKDYVLKIFSAAVIGEDPRAYGFDFDNPLLPYVEQADLQIAGP